MPANVNFDTMLSTTMNNYRKTMEDNLSKNVPLWHFLKQSGKVNKGGGVKIIEPILHGPNTTAGSYAGYDILPLTPQEGVSAAEYDWKQHAVTVIISGIEEAKNSGEHAVVSLLQTKIEQAEITAIDQFDVMFNGDGTGNSGKNFLGLKAIIGDNASTVTTVGNINCTTAGNEFWRSYVDRVAEQLTIEKMTKAYHQAVRGRNQPKYAQTTLALFESYNAQLQVNQRFTDPKTAEAGFQNLTFQGKPLMWGDNNEAGVVMFVNTDFLRLNTLGDTWLKNSKFTEPDDQDARSCKILSYGQLSCSNRKLAGSRLEGKTA